MATFNERRAPASRKYVAEQGIVMPNWSKIIQIFWWHSSVLTLEKLRKNLNFQSCLRRIDPFHGYFQWNAWTDFQKICSWTRYSDAKLIKNISNLLVAILRFYFRKLTLNLNFQSVFTSNRPFGGYFQWNPCTDFQKICIWIRYSDVTLIKIISNFFVALLRFWFRKTT